MQADSRLDALARATGCAAIGALNGATLLSERAMLRGLRVPGRIAAGGGCLLFDALDGLVALSLARVDDRALLPALFECERLDPDDDIAIAAQIATRGSHELVARGRSMGLALAAETEADPAPLAVTPLASGRAACGARRDRPRVLDLSALWAGPLATHLLQLAGAEVVKVESVTRPDGARRGDPRFFALLNQHKAAVALDLASPAGRDALLGLIRAADIVVEASRPRALRQLGIDADRLVAERPNLAWITITAHGADGGAADWIGFGDDVSVAAGLAAAMRGAAGTPGFIGDAVADPLTGIIAAQVAWSAWTSGCGGRIGVAMRGVVAECLAEARGAAFDADLRGWHAAAGGPFPPVTARMFDPAAALGADTAITLESWLAC